MSDIRDWSPIADDNDSPSPDGYPENMPASGVNNSDRETQAAVRRWYVVPTWRDLGYTVQFVSSTTAQIVGDLTTEFFQWQRVRSTDNTSALVHGTITDVNFDNTNTVLTLDWTGSNPWESSFLFFMVAGDPSGDPIHYQSIYGLNEQLLAAQGQAGDIFPWGGTIPRVGNDALVCNGNPFDATIYPKLAAAIGTQFGGTAQNPNTPNLRGCVISGRDGNQGRLTQPFFGADPDQRGAVGGTESRALTTNEMPAHSHRIENVRQVQSDTEAGPNSATTSQFNGARPDIITTTEGNGQAFSIVQPTMVLEWYIKTGELP